MKDEQVRGLTKAEEEVMQVLWMLNRAFVKDVLECFEEPKPAYNTVSTIVRILEEKGFVSHEAFGKSHQYYPLISKQDYSRQMLKNLTKGYFSNSFKNLVSFMAEENELSIRDIEELKELITKNKKS